MRVIGVLGGMSWESTAEYYRLLNTLTAERLGGLHSADLLLRSVDFAEIEALQVAGDWERAGTVLAEAAGQLEQGGADLLVLATNTMHKVSDRIEQRCGIPLIHIGDVTAAAVRAAGLRHVGLLGTRFTMEQSFAVDRLASHGLTVDVPAAARTGPRCTGSSTRSSASASSPRSPGTRTGRSSAGWQPEAAKV